MPHLVVSISGHGFGHVAQTAPILNLLHARMPELRLTLRTSVPLAHLRSRIRAPFEYLSSEGDIGMVMSSALDVMPDESHASYLAFHANWEERISGEAHLLQILEADVVLSNVGYLALAGAQRAGIPNAALCSLNWFDIYSHYLDDRTIAAQILACYANADAFLRTTPGMAMSNLTNLVTLAPIAETGRDRRDELDRLLDLPATEKLVLVTMGGIATRIPMERWPRVVGVRWLVQESWQVNRPDTTAIESLPFNFADLLASSDALLCKPGYGSFVEAACSGIPVLYVSRADWPESPALIAWLQQHGVCRELSREQLERGDIAAALSGLWAAPQVTPPLANGAAEAADWLQRKLSLSGD